MKKCPFCKADIEDNARFCLYCMKPLNEKEVILPPQKKKMWWPLAVAGILLVVLLAVILLVPRGQNALFAESTGEEIVLSTQSTTEENTIETTQDAESEEGIVPEDTGEEPIWQPSTTTKPNQAPEQKQENDTPKPSDTTSSDPTQEQEPDDFTSEPPENTKPVITPTPETKPDEVTQNTSPSTEPEETTPEVTEQEDIQTGVVYAYRPARAGDDFNANYTNSGNDIVITGIVQQSADGTYDIPSYIDGQRVIAIVANAFSGSNAKIVFVSATVKTIWNYAFAGCGLTDIYFRGSTIYAESKAFDSALTIHCSASCSDRDFHYYKNCAASYGATWEEWNG